MVLPRPQNGFRSTPGGDDAAYHLAFRTNHTLIQAFTSNAKDERASIPRSGMLLQRDTGAGRLFAWFAV